MLVLMDEELVIWQIESLCIYCC